MPAVLLDRPRHSPLRFLLGIHVAAFGGFQTLLDPLADVNPILNIVGRRIAGELIEQIDHFRFGSFDRCQYSTAAFTYNCRIVRSPSSTAR